MRDRVGIIGCGATKQEATVAARDLYTGPLFTAARAWVERHTSDWVILSARHGVLLPDQVIAPYNLSLGDLSRDDRRRWSAHVYNRLIRLFPGRSFVCLAGSLYRRPLERLDCIFPLAGLGIGKQLQWLKVNL